MICVRYYQNIIRNIIINLREPALFHCNILVDSIDSGFGPGSQRGSEEHANPSAVGQGQIRWAASQTNGGYPRWSSRVSAGHCMGLCMHAPIQ